MPITLRTLRVVPLLVLLAGVSGFACFAAARPTQAVSLAQQIRTDRRLDHVLTMARTTLKGGLAAGDGYDEVWIRDLNSFIAVSLEVNDRATIRQALLRLLAFQAADGGLPDGYVAENLAKGYYAYQHSTLAPGFLAHKNTVETDQESSLVQAVSAYVRVTHDAAILDTDVGGETVRARLGRALGYVRAARFDEPHGLVWGGTTADWGDLEPEETGGTVLTARSHRAIDVYDNAMYAIAIDDYLHLPGGPAPDAAIWEARQDELRTQTRAVLWDATRGQFLAHVYLDRGSPFPATFDERAVDVHGGTTMAIEAGFLSADEIPVALAHMRADVWSAGAGSIGLSLYPPYPAGAFSSPGMEPFMYQNGGDWCWFGGRTVQALIARGLVADAYRELSPMVVRVERADDFVEWWTRDNQPRGSGQFRGSAGVLGRAIEMLQAWADTTLRADGR